MLAILFNWCSFHCLARTKTTPSGDKLEGGPVSDLQSDEATKMKKERDKEDKKAAKKMKKEKELKSPVEAQPPLGPLVALGKPREKPTKRPRCVWRKLDMTFDLLNSSHFNIYYLLYNNAILIGFLYCFITMVTTLHVYSVYMYIVLT